MAYKISPFQMTDGQNWSGLTTENHFSSIYQMKPQKASKLMTKIHNTNFGMDLDSYLDKFDPLWLDDDRDFTWDLIGTARTNVPLIEARMTEDGSAVQAGDQPGIGASAFYMVFPEAQFTDVNIIVGPKNEKYPVQIIEDPRPEGTNYVYKVQLITNNEKDFVPIEELKGGTRWSKDWSLVEKTMSKKGGGVHYNSPITMRNSLTMIRMQDTMPGNMINRPFATAWKNDEGQTFTTWMQYRDYQFDQQFRREKSRALMFATSNRSSDGQYLNKGKSGYVKQQGAGIRQQMEAANTSYYNQFSIDYLIDVLMDLSEGRLPTDQRKFVLMTGERGAVQFHKAIEEKTQLFKPLFNQDRMFKKAGGDVQLGLGYGGQFIEYLGPNNIVVGVQVHSMYDDRERNKIYHPNGGVAESYRYDILDVGTTDGEPNIRKVYVKGADDIWGYEPGLRDPFSPTNSKRRIMATPEDAYTIHRACTFGAMVKDPSKTASIIPNMLY